MNRSSSARGFTLMELIVTIAVSAIFMVSSHYVWTNVFINYKKQKDQLQAISQLKNQSIRLQTELYRSYEVDCDAQEWVDRDGTQYTLSALFPSSDRELQVSFECFRKNGKYSGIIERFSDVEPTQIVWSFSDGVLVFEGSVWLEGLVGGE